MTLYFSGAADSTNDAEWSPATEGSTEIIENTPAYIRFTDDGEMVLTVDQMYDEKQKVWMNMVKQMIEDSDVYELVSEPQMQWVGGYAEK